MKPNVQQYRSCAWPLAGLVPLLVLATACGGGSNPVAPPPPPPPPAPVASVEVSPGTADLVIGGMQQLSATMRDAGGGTLSGRTATWSSSAPGVASVSASGLVTGVTVGTATITATSEGRSGTATITVSPVPVANVLVTPGTAEVVLGFTQQLSAAPRDAANNPLTDRPVTWSSSNTTVASVSTAGLVTAVAVGQATITATSEGQSGTATITVIPVPVATVVVTPPTSTVEVNATQQLAAATLDADNNPLPDRPVAWSSSNATIASVSATGLVTGVAIGTVTITATSEGKSGTAQVTVTPVAGSPVITGISPAILVPGATATITGTGFSATPVQNNVTLQGVPMPVTAASTTQLTVAVPCVNGGPQAVSVTSAGLQGLPVNHPVGTTQQALAVGQAAIITDAADVTCNEIPFGGDAGRYVVTVYSVATSPNTLTDFHLSGNPASAAEPMAVIQAPVRRPAETRLTPAQMQQAEWDRAHFWKLEENRRILEEGVARGHHLVAADHPIGAAPSLGDTRTLNFRFAGGCVAPTQFVSGKAIYVGTRSVIWEDQNNTVLSSASPALAAAYQRIGTLFDTEQFDIVKDNFGDPLRRDLDGDALVHMVFSQLVNGIAAGFVTSCDQFPPATHPSSNFGEFFYAMVPTSAATGSTATTTVDGWLYFMMRTVIHEVKHIASHAARFANSSPVFEVSWQEEATARHSEEVWVRQHIHQVPWKGNSGWGTAASNGVFCDFHLTNAACTAGDPAHRPNWGMLRHFWEFRNRLLEPWNWSPFGDGTGQTGSVFYQVGWSLIRYTIDRFGTSDAGFLTALNQATTSGVTNLAARAGVSIEELLGGWGLALYADDFPGLVNPDPAIQFPTWNLRDIYAGANASPTWVGEFPSPFLLVPTQLSSPSFTTTRTGVRGGAHDYFELAGVPGGTQLLNLRAIGGGPPSANLRIAIARLQ